MDIFNYISLFSGLLLNDFYLQKYNFILVSLLFSGILPTSFI